MKTITPINKDYVREQAKAKIEAIKSYREKLYQKGLKTAMKPRVVGSPWWKKTIQRTKEEAEKFLKFQERLYDSSDNFFRVEIRPIWVGYSDNWLKLSEQLVQAADVCEGPVMYLTLENVNWLAKKY